MIAMIITDAKGRRWSESEVTISLVVYDSSILAVDTDWPWVDMQDYRLQT